MVRDPGARGMGLALSGVTDEEGDAADGSATLVLMGRGSPCSGSRTRRAMPLMGSKHSGQPEGPALHPVLKASLHEAILAVPTLGGFRAASGG